MSGVTYAGLTDVGRIRRENEDRWFADPKRGLYLVADGMGGSAAGGVAAQVVVEVLPRLLHARLESLEDLDEVETKEAVLSAIVELSNRLKREARNRLGAAGVGSTAVLAILNRNRALVAHLGDSRAYLLRDGRLEQLTCDHTVVQILVESGEITTEEAQQHPARDQLTRYVGMTSAPLPDARLVNVTRGDRLLLCSDGLTKMLREEEVSRILREEADPEDCCQQLIRAANEAGGEDNITAVVLTIS